MAASMDRPPIWIGHVQLRTPLLDDTEAFLKRVGLRPITRGDAIAVLELRGGTHIVLIQDEHAEPQTANFDFMVEDIRATRKAMTAMGLEVSELEEGRIHTSFVVTEPGGNHITVNSSHVPDHDKV